MASCPVGQQVFEPLTEFLNVTNSVVYCCSLAASLSFHFYLPDCEFLNQQLQKVFLGVDPESRMQIKKNKTIISFLAFLFIFKMSTKIQMDQNYLYKENWEFPTKKKDITKYDGTLIEPQSVYLVNLAVNKISKVQLFPNNLR